MGLVISLICRPINFSSTFFIFEDRFVFYWSDLKSLLAESDSLKKYYKKNFLKINKKCYQELKHL